MQRAENFDDESDMVDAFVACGGRSDKGGHVKRDTLVKVRAIHSMCKYACMYIWICMYIHIYIYIYILRSDKGGYVKRDTLVNVRTIQ
jgi:hypothetical protein